MEKDCLLSSLKLQMIGDVVDLNGGVLSGIVRKSCKATHGLLIYGIPDDSI